MDRGGSEVGEHTSAGAGGADDAGMKACREKVVVLLSGVELRGGLEVRGACGAEGEVRGVGAGRVGGFF